LKEISIHRGMRKLVFLALMTLLGAPSLTKAGIQDRLYDFTDAY